MRYAILAFMLVAVFAACDTTETPQTVETFTCPDGSEVTDLADCPEPDAPETQEPVAEQPDTEAPPEDEEDVATARRVFAGDDAPPTESVAPELEAMRERAEEKTPNGYAYTYFHADDSLPVNQIIEGSRIFVREDGYAIDFESERTLDRQNRINRGLAMDGEEPIAWCERCGEEGEVYSLEGRFDIIHAEEWLYLLEDSEFESSSTLQGRQATEISGEVDGVDTRIWVDQFSGLPLKAQQGTEVWQYKQLGLSTSDEQFEAPTAS